MATDPTLNQQPLIDDSTSVYDALTKLTTGDGSSYNAIVRPNNPPLGVGGFIFDIPGDQEIRLRSQITNYFLESNTTIQDNIAVEPAMITLRGVVAELVFTAPLNPTTTVPTTTNPDVPAMMPAMTLGQIETYSAAASAAAARSTSQANQAAGSSTSQSMYQFYQTSSTGSNPSLTRQSSAFLYFLNLWSGQQLVSVETPWGVFQNCGILEVRVVQDEKTRYATDFTVSFQEIRFAQPVLPQTGNVAGRTALQQQSQTQNGQMGQTPIDQSPFVQNVQSSLGAAASQTPNR